MRGEALRIALNGRFYAARPTGVQRFAREIASRLCEGAEVALLLPRSVSPDGVRGARRVVHGALGGHLWEQLELPWRARAAGCDVTLHLANNAPRWGGPNVMVVHDVTPLTHPHWYSTGFAWWWRLTVAPAIKRAARVLAVSEWAREEIVRTLGVSRERIGVVYQGVGPFDRPAEPEAAQAVLARYGLTPGYLLAVGGSSARKNVRFLLEVLAAERGAHLPQLVVVGEPYDWIHGEGGTGNREGLDKLAKWLGHVSDDDLRALYTGASVFCFPSLAEGFGRPPLEAMACGTPVVVAHYGPAREVLGDSAMILPLDARAWIGAIERLVRDSVERQRWVAAGRRRAAEFRWEPAVETIVGACFRVGERGTGKGER